MFEKLEKMTVRRKILMRFLCTKIRETAGGKKIRELALRGIQSSYTAHGETLPPATSLKMRAHEKMIINGVFFI